MDIQDDYYCNKCNFKTERKSHWLRHLKTKKHLGDDYDDTLYNKFVCCCGKKYKFLSGLSRHRQKCKLYESQINEATNMIIPKTQDNSETNILKEQNEFLKHQMGEMKDIFYKLIENNKELQEATLMIAKEPRTINNNNQFNIMNYLNTECKDAINISEFIDQLKYTFKDLLKINDEGWVENVKNTFVKQLKDMEQSKRPIHCSDKKRKTFYIKDNDEWTRDNVQQKMNETIRKFHTKQSKVYVKWKKLNFDRVQESDDLHDQSMYMNLELCKVSCDDGSKLKNKVMNSLTDLTLVK